MPDHRANLLAAGALLARETGARVFVGETWCTRHGQPNCATCRAEAENDEVSGRPVADTAEATIDRYMVREWTRDIGARHNDLRCLGGACDGGEDGGSKCKRHEKTGELITRLVRLRHRRNERNRVARLARSKLEDRLARHHVRLPCHKDDLPCSDDHVCWTHRETDQYVDRVLARFERLRGRP